VNRPWTPTLGDRFLSGLRKAIPFPELRHEALMPTARALSIFLPWDPPASAATARAFRDGTSLSLRTPLILAAGANKAARCLDAFASVGFGAVTVGTATLRPRAGNPLKPRVHTLEGTDAIQNAMGLNNPGIRRLAERIERSRPACEEAGLAVGLSISEDPSLLPGEDPDANVLECLALAYPVSDYLELNLSCPNTGHDRLDSAWDRIERLLGKVSDFRERQGRRIPLWVKLSPDLTGDGLQAALETVQRSGLTGSVLSNTWPAASGTWPDGSDLPRLQEVGRPGLRGGLSGRPLYSRTLQSLRQAREAAPGLSHLAVGGVETGAQARELLDSGADFVECYSVLAFRWLAGRKIVEECSRASK
jgi:dihydroorotate dehydrogenase